MKPQCQEKVFKPITGQEGQLTQCKRYAVEGSVYCKMHKASNRPQNRIEDKEYACGCLAKDGIITKCEKHKGL